MNRKLRALLLIPVAMLCFLLGFGGMAYLHESRGAAIAVLMAGLASGLSVTTIANRLWQQGPGTPQTPQPIPANHRQCDWCCDVVHDSRGKLVAMPGFRGLRLVPVNQFVCRPCMRRHRKMQALAVLSVLGTVGGFLLTLYLLVG